MKHILLLTGFVIAFTQLIYGQSNLALYGISDQSSITNDGFSQKAHDGVISGNWSDGSVTHTADEPQAWWQIDLMTVANIGHITLYNRTDCCSNRLSDFYLIYSGFPFETDNLDEILNDPNFNAIYFEETSPPVNDIIINDFMRYVRIQKAGNGVLSLAEVQVFENQSGLLFQNISPVAIEKLSAESPPVVLEASTSSGLAPEFSIESGPATIAGNMLTLNGDAGTVIVAVDQAGDNTYSPAETAFIEIDIIDPESITPLVNLLTITETYGVEMETLKPIDVFAAAEIEHPEIFSIDSVVFSIDGQTFTGIQHPNGNYFFTWTPEDYGTFAMKAFAFGNNGVSSFEQIPFEIKEKQDQTQMVPAIIDGDIIWTQTSLNYYTISDLPTSLDSYNKITAFLDISCPPGGCDPWDRVAQVWARQPGSNSWTEIIRYITPYGVACDHSIDISEYASILTGETEFRVYIESYAGGWRVNLNLEYETGTPEYTYSKIDRIWNGVLPFGNMANIQPADTVLLEFDERAEDAMLRLVTTGHGWGDNNTANAAEFRNSTHQVWVNDEMFTHNPWEFCDPNPDGCQPQNGSWEFARAGWCPGAIAHGDTYGLQSYIPNGSATLKFILDPNYTDFCHISNPNCITGQTCIDCSDGFNPVLYTASNVISFSNAIMSFIPEVVPVAIEQESQFEMNVLPNPSDGKYWIEQSSGDTSNRIVQLFDIKGKIILQFNWEGSQKAINIEDQADGIYILKIRSFEGDTYTKQLIKQ